jgi:hypothetical protein
MTKMTRKYRTLVRCTADLQLGVKMHLIPLGAKLVSVGLITPDQYREIRNRHVSRLERAADLVDSIQVKVQQDPKCFYVFTRILEDINKYDQIMYSPWYDIVYVYESPNI